MLTQTHAQQDPQPRSCCRRRHTAWRPRLCERSGRLDVRLRREAFGTVWQLQQVHPGRPEAVAFEAALAAVVDAAGVSPEAVDGAYFELEDMHAKVRISRCIALSTGWPRVAMGSPRFRQQLCSVQ